MRRGTLLVGIGSPHGDDQVGWLVAEEIRRINTSAAVHLARTPTDLFKFIEAAQRLLICDACSFDATPGTVRMWKWPQLPVDIVAFRGTHDVSLTVALEMAERLNLLPPEVLIWGIQVQSTIQTQEVSADVLSAAKSLAITLVTELDDSSCLDCKINPLGETVGCRPPI